MQWPGIMSAISAGIGAVAVMLVALRRIFTSRVQAIVDVSIQHVIDRQNALEARITSHLTRQDKTIHEILKRVR